MQVSLKRRSALFGQLLIAWNRIAKSPPVLYIIGIPKITSILAERVKFRRCIEPSRRWNPLVGIQCLINCEYPINIAVPYCQILDNKITASLTNDATKIWGRTTHISKQTTTDFGCNFIPRQPQDYPCDL